MKLDKRGIQAISVGILVVAMTFTAFQVNATFGGSLNMIPHTPCDPLPVFGTVWIKTNTTTTTANNAVVDLNFSYANSSGPNQWVTHTNGVGQYQVSSLPVGSNPPGCLPASGGTIKIWTPGTGNVTHQNQTTIVYPQTSINNGYLNDTLTYPQLKPTLTANVTSGEATLNVKFSDPPTGGNGNYVNWNWHFGDTLQANSANDSFNHAYHTVGVYNARLILNDSAGNSWETAAVQITVNAPPSISSFSAAPSVFNISKSTTFSVTITGGTANFNYAYQAGDGTGTISNNNVASRTNTLVHTYAHISGALGSQANVTVTDADSKITPVSSIVVWVYNVANHPGIPQSDAGQSVTWTASAAGGTGTYNYCWIWGDASHTAAQLGNTASHTFTNAGIYMVQLELNDTGHSPNMIMVFYNYTVNAALNAPVPTATPNPTDVGVAVTFGDVPTGGTAPFSYAWRFGDGQTTPSHSLTPVHVFNATGSFVVRFWINDSVGMFATNTVTVVVNNLPNPTLNVMNITTMVVTTTGYVGETLEFYESAMTGGTGPFQYDFIYGDAGSSGYQVGTSANHAYAATGTYDATLDVKDSVGGIGISTQVAITIYAVLTSTSLTANRTAGELNLAVSFTSTVSGGVPALSYSWQFGDGNSGVTGVGTNTHTYTKIENASVNVTITDSQGEKVIQHLYHIFVYGPLVVTIHETRPAGNFNPPLNVTYTQTITGGSFSYTSVSWNFGNGNSSAVPESQTYWHSGVYTITLTVADNASDHSAPTYSLTVYGSNAPYITLQVGWNLICLPYINTNYDMWLFQESLVLSGAAWATTSIAVQNTAAAGNITFPGIGANANYAIGQARGIWVDVATTVNVMLSGNMTAGPLGAATTLQAGWNNIGWALTGASTAAAVVGLISGATMISMWSASTQAYTTYIVNFDTPASTYNFAVVNGQGLLVWVPSAGSFTE